MTRENYWTRKLLSLSIPALVCIPASSVCSCDVGLFQYHIHIYQTYVRGLTLSQRLLHVLYWL